MPKPLNQVYPDQAIAICTREQAAQLVDYDHHTVDIYGRPGVMLTSGLLPLEEYTGPFALTVVSYYAEKHPRVPENMQSIVNQLQFQVRGQAR